MDHNLAVKTKKMWNIVRAVLFMLRKGISKRKLMLELSLLMKRGKIAGKTMINNLIFHHHHHHHNHSDDGPREYEFSCSNSPAYFPFNLNKRRRHQHHQDEDDIAAQLDEHDLTSLNSVDAVLERLNSDALILKASPLLSGFGQSSMARQMRITDSPYPVQEVEDDHGQVDKAADEFIKKFYKQLKQQKRLSNEEYRC